MFRSVQWLLARIVCCSMACALISLVYFFFVCCTTQRGLGERTAYVITSRFSSLFIERQQPVSMSMWAVPSQNIAHVLDTCAERGFCFYLSLLILSIQPLDTHTQHSYCVAAKKEQLNTQNRTRLNSV